MRVVTKNGTGKPVKGMCVFSHLYICVIYYNLYRYIEKWAILGQKYQVVYFKYLKSVHTYIEENKYLKIYIHIYICISKLAQDRAVPVISF